MMRLIQRQRHGRSLAGNVALTMIALAFSGMVPFGFNLIVGHRYGPAGLGEVSVVLGLALFLGQVPGTLGPAATKFLAEALSRGEQDAARTIFQFVVTVSVGLASALTLGMAAAAPLLASTLHVRVGTVLLGAVLVLVYALYLLFKSVYYGLQRVGAYVFNEIVSDVLFFVALTVVLLVGATPWLLAPFILNDAIFLARALYDQAPYVRRFNWGRAAPRRAILRYYGLSGTGTIISIGRTALGTTIAGLFLSHHAVGLYAAALTLTNPLFLLPQALSYVLFAAMAFLYGAGQGGSVRELLQRSTQWLVAALGLVCGLVIINAGIILTVVFPADYGAATATFQVIVAGAYVSMICSPSVNALSSTAYVGIPTLAAIGGFITSLVAWLLCIPRIGIVGVALGYSVGVAVTGSIAVYCATRFLGASPAAFLRAGTVMASVACVLFGLGSTPLLASIIFVILVALLYARPGIAIARRLAASSELFALARAPRHPRWLFPSNMGPTGRLVTALLLVGDGILVAVLFALSR